MSPTYGFPLVVLLCALVLARPGRLPARVALAARSPLAPWAVAAATFALLAWVWGGLRPWAVVHDEAAYLLQARIFAHGHWTGPHPPIPEFFEQFHVLVEPRLAGKYPPGHSLLLVPGVWLGVPGLVPLLLDALAGALLFVLARRALGAGAALLAWAVWITARGTDTALASYFSETTTTALWLAGWWLVLRWRERRGAGTLILLTALVAWGGITRPLTMFAYMLPVAAVLAPPLLRERRWRQIGVAAAAGLAICAIVPLWSARTAGSWRTNPYREYSRIYFPFDHPGFGPDPSPPLRPLQPEMREYYADNSRYRAAHLPERLPGTLLLRARMALRGVFCQGPYGVCGWRGWLVPLAVIGVVAAPAPLWFAIGTALLLFFSYAGFYHKAEWALYYTEALPVVGAVAACGARLAAGALARRAAGTARGWRLRRDAVLAAAAVCVLAFSARPLTLLRQMNSARAAYFRDFARRADAIPEPRAMVFVRYAPRHIYHNSLIENAPDWRTARVWVVRDRGADNARLMRADPRRAAYLYDESAKRMLRIDPAHPSPASTPIPPR
ncbi:MAG TPA: hypothetical protein VFJ82_04950 [Longimicrobium sp.]|nr:hypothetical protein [Longimicrobium sp.]